MVWRIMSMADSLRPCKCVVAYGSSIQGFLFRQECTILWNNDACPLQPVSGKWIIDLRQDVGNTHAIFHLTSSNRLSICLYSLCRTLLHRRASGLWRNYSIEAGFLTNRRIGCRFRNQGQDDVESQHLAGFWRWNRPGYGRLPLVLKVEMPLDFFESRDKQHDILIERHDDIALVRRSYFTFISIQ